MATRVYRGGYWPYRKPITCVAHEWSQGIQLKVAEAEAWEYSRDTGLLLEGERLTNDSEVSGRGLIVKEIPAGYGGRTSTEGRDGVMLSGGSRSAVLRPSSGVAGGSILAEGREVPEQAPWYTVVGVIDDGSQLNQAVTEVRELGVDRDDLTVVLKREDLATLSPFRRAPATSWSPGTSAGSGWCSASPSPSSL